MLTHNPCRRQEPPGADFKAEWQQVKDISVIDGWVEGGGGICVTMNDSLLMYYHEVVDAATLGRASRDSEAAQIK
ncbi:hypothetical protein SCAR479_03257 [Seiridium cardinale]|uniref:Uncharacterized protein n=1 Tax=Seiridium cardinale TaxID=138064 RepID=A0ABR2Y1J1_9PEZI